MVINETDIALGNGWSDCPQCWQNFITDIRDRHRTNPFDDISMNDLYTELVKFNGVITSSNDKLYSCIIKFNTPKDKTWFLLTWS